MSESDRYANLIVNCVKVGCEWAMNDSNKATSYTIVRGTAAEKCTGQIYFLWCGTCGTVHAVRTARTARFRPAHVMPLKQ